MKLGLFIGYSGAQIHLPVETAQQAERLGYDSVWTSEAYGSDAITPLAYLAAKTDRIRLGTLETGAIGGIPGVTDLIVEPLVLIERIDVRPRRAQLSRLGVRVDDMASRPDRGLDRFRSAAVSLA